MNNPVAPDSLARIDLVIDYELWLRLQQEADRRGADLGAMVSKLLDQQLQCP